jgi:hypothetical protein
MVPVLNTWLHESVEPAEDAAHALAAALLDGPDPLALLAADPRLRDLVACVEKLLVLKDGPRDETYRIGKPHAWADLRTALAGLREATGGC